MLSYVLVMWNLHTWWFLPIEFPILLCKLLLINAIRIGKFLLKWSVYISWMLSRQNSQHSFVGKIPKAYRGLTACSAVKGPEVGFSSEVPGKMHRCDLGSVAAAATSGLHFTWWLLLEEKVDTLDWRECCKGQGITRRKGRGSEWSWDGDGEVMNMMVRSWVKERSEVGRVLVD